MEYRLKHNNASNSPHVADVVDPLQGQKVELGVAADLLDVAAHHHGLTAVAFHHDHLLNHDSTPQTVFT